MKLLLRAGAGLLVLTALAIAVPVVIYWAPDLPVEALTARWAQAPSQFRDIAGLPIHFRDEGPRQDPVPIVLLHGTSASLHTWDGWTGALAQQRRVIRYDMPGFGLTGPAPDANYTIENYARVLIAVLDSLGVQRCVLAGNSLGGYVAWATTMLYPERVERLILVDASGYPFQSASVPAGFKIARTPVLNRMFEQMLPRALVASSVRNVYGNPARVTAAVVDRYYDLTRRAGNRRALAERFQQTQPGALARRIPEIKVPTLIVWGAEDRLIPPALGARFDAEIPDSRLVVLPGLGHMPHEEDPDASLVPVREFLSP